LTGTEKPSKALQPKTTIQAFSFNPLKVWVMNMESDWWLLIYKANLCNIKKIDIVINTSDIVAMETIPDALM
jgi:nucleoside 2-deoxyribosyltransferase